jgi:hypothetical protein
MLNISGAKTDILKKQSNRTLETLAKVLEINTNDLEFKLGAELEFYIKDDKNEPGSFLSSFLCSG